MTFQPLAATIGIVIQAVSVTMTAMRRNVVPHSLIATRTVLIAARAVFPFPRLRCSALIIDSSFGSGNFEGGGSKAPAWQYAARSLRIARNRVVGYGGVPLRGSFGLALKEGPIEGAKR